MRIRLQATALSFVLMACGGEPGGDSARNEPAPAQGMDRGVAGALQDAPGGLDPKRPLANAARLAEFLPDSVGGFRRFELRWTPKKRTRDPVRNARATFADSASGAQTGPRVVIELTDMGRMARSMGSIVRSARDYDRDGEAVRTFSLEGHRGVEQTDREASEATILLLLSDRLILEVAGRGVDLAACRAALNRVDRAGLIRAEASGALTELSELERIELPSKEQVESAYPASLPGQARIQFEAYEMGEQERPYLFARGVYANMVGVEVRIFKKAEHATVERPMGLEDAAINTYFGYTGNEITVREDEWRGTPIVIVTAPRSGQQAILRIVSSCVALEVRGEDNPDQLKHTLDSLEALLSLSPTGGGGS